MSESQVVTQVVSGLAEKRAELAAHTQHERPELQRLTQEQGHRDATIRRFDPTLAGGFAARPHRGMTENMLTSPGIDHP